jgi:hypothetical protein
LYAPTEAVNIVTGNDWFMNIDTFTSLKLLMKDLECGTDNSLSSVNEVKAKCQQALQLIDDLRYKHHSAHVQLATRQAIQYINKGLYEIEAYLAAYDPATKTSTVTIKDICSPVHAGLETILNLNY